MKLIENRTTFAHDKEDIRIEELIGEVKSFIDIGANDGILHSNVYKFILQGATGLSVEPIPSIYEKLVNNYKDYKNVTCVNTAVSNVSKIVVMKACGVLSHIQDTADDKLCSRIKTEPPYEVRDIRIECKKVSDIINEYWSHKDDIDLISVDVEGHDYFVLQGLPEDINIKCIVVETHSNGGQGRYEWKHSNYKEIMNLMKSKGYKVACKTLMNTIFVKE